MKEERRAKRISEQASKFKLRANKSYYDNKRHDLVKSDELRVMYTAYAKLGWSFAKIGSTFDRDPRTVKQCIQRRQRSLTKHEEYQLEVERHRTELSNSLLAIASNLERYRNNLVTFLGGSHKIEGLVYGGSMYEMHTPDFGQSVELQQVDKDVARNLLSHLKEGFPELTDIKDWTELTDDKITEDFIGRLKLKAYRGEFKGKCEACPS